MSLFQLSIRSESAHETHWMRTAWVHYSVANHAVCLVWQMHEAALLSLARTSHYHQQSATWASGLTPNLTFEDHINHLCKVSFLHLRNIARLHPALTLRDAEKLIQGFVSSRLGLLERTSQWVPQQEHPETATHSKQRCQDPAQSTEIWTHHTHPVLTTLASHLRRDVASCSSASMATLLSTSKTFSTQSAPPTATGFFLVRLETKLSQNIWGLHRRLTLY